MAKFELSIVETYVGEWTYIQAIRELLQNTIDQETVTGLRSKIEYNESEQQLTLTNPNTQLEASSLLLGSTSKTDDSTTIGQFGEGYKLALLTLTRENKPVEILNKKINERWTARFVNSRRYGGNRVLTVFTERMKTPESDLVFKINNITKDEYETIKNSALFLKNNYHEIEQIKTPLGNIIMNPDEKGNIYINGLFVTKLQYNIQHGYDIHPQYIRINRDRNMMAQSGIFQITNHMWMSVMDQHMDKIEHLLDINASDVDGSDNAYDTKIPYSDSSEIDDEEDNYTDEQESTERVEDLTLTDHYIKTKRPFTRNDVRLNNKRFAESKLKQFIEKYGHDFVVLDNAEKDSTLEQQLKARTQNIIFVKHSIKERLMENDEYVAILNAIQQRELPTSHARLATEINQDIQEQLDRIATFYPTESETLRFLIDELTTSITSNQLQLSQEELDATHHEALGMNEDENDDHSDQDAIPVALVTASDNDFDDLPF